MKKIDLPDIHEYMAAAEKQKQADGKISPLTAPGLVIVGFACCCVPDGGFFVGMFLFILALAYRFAGQCEDPPDCPRVAGESWEDKHTSFTSGGVSSSIIPVSSHEWASDPFPASDPDPFFSGDYITDPVYSYLPGNIFHESISDTFSSSTDLFNDTFSSTFSSDPFNSGMFE